jgi:hypothetical protein
MTQKIRSRNTTFSSDSDAIRVPVGSTADRTRSGESALSGQIRFNSSLGALEYYTGSDWVVLDQAPTITSINPSNIAIDGSTLHTVTITGTGFNSSTTVSLTSDDTLNTITPATVTYISSTSISFTFSANQIETVTGLGASYNPAKDPFDVTVTSLTGKTSTLPNALSTNSDLYWVTAAGNLTNTFSSNRVVSVSLEARDPESTAVTYTVTSGSLPTGLSLNSSTGVISGTNTNAGSLVTSNFTVTANDAASIHQADREFNIVSYPATIETFTTDGTFNVPIGLTSVDVLVVAGGGGGSGQCCLGGGGGGGGLIYRPGLPITPGSPISVTVGGSGAGGWDGADPTNRGGSSIFSGLTAIGGGGGGAFSTGKPGGSGGGGGGNSFQGGPQGGGSGIQPSQPGESGSYGFGNPGGSGSPNNGPSRGGGGGGAGSGGQPAPGPTGPGGVGGNGRDYSISGSSVNYSGGGGARPSGSGGGSSGGASGSSGVTNRGGGGGAAAAGGGTGVVIVSY